MTDRSFRAPHGFEIVASATPARAHCEVLLERGVLAKDTHETTIRLAPPLVITGEDRQARDVGYEDCAHGVDASRRRRPLRDSVVWIAAYDVGRYPVSDSGVPIPPVNGFRVTGNVGCFAYQLTAGDDLARSVLVLPPPSWGGTIVSTGGPQPLKGGNITVCIRSERGCGSYGKGIEANCRLADEARTAGGLI